MNFCSRQEYHTYYLDQPMELSLALGGEELSMREMVILLCDVSQSRVLKPLRFLKSQIQSSDNAY